MSGIYCLEKRSPGLSEALKFRVTCAQLSPNNQPIDVGAVWCSELGPLLTAPCPAGDREAWPQGQGRQLRKFSDVQ